MAHHHNILEKFFFERMICCICQDAEEECTDISELRCGHQAHSKCLATWLTHKRECPICRTSICNNDSDLSESDSDDSEAENDMTLQQRRELLQRQQHILTNIMRRKSTLNDPTLKKKCAKLRLLRSNRAHLIKMEISPQRKQIEEHDAHTARLIKTLHQTYRRSVRQMNQEARISISAQKRHYNKLVKKRSRLDKSIEKLSDEILLRAHIESETH